MFRSSIAPLASTLRSRATLSTRSFAASPPPSKPTPTEPTPSLPPSPPGAPTPGTGSNAAVPAGIAIAGAVGAYLFFKEKDQQVTGGDITKGPKDGQPSRMAG